ncbi:MAG TPA: SDR family oxidoreductase [Acidimicrobiia bacterium]|nr:SDR family oxidoreductase [Acidimicrobiia bacterium]
MTADGRELAGLAALVTGVDRPIGDGLARALADAGATVAVRGSHLDPVDNVFATARDELGADVDVVVHAALPPGAAELLAFEEVTDERWETVWERGMRTTLALLQGAFPAMRERGRGRFVFVSPTLSMSGAPGLVPLTAYVEGQRLLAKSAARQWGPYGITVNCVAPAPELAVAGTAAGAVSLAAPALGGPGDARDDLGPVVTFLASDAAHFVTGVTVCADGGVWMAP